MLVNLNQAKSQLTYHLGEAMKLSEELIAAGVLVEDSLDLEPAFQLVANTPIKLPVSTGNNPIWPPDGSDRSYPRADGAVQSQIYNGWLHENGISLANRWFFAEETAKEAELKEHIAFNVRTNCDNARMSGSFKGQTAEFAYWMTRDPTGQNLWIQGARINDAFALRGSLVYPNGFVKWKAPGYIDQLKELLEIRNGPAYHPGILQCVYPLERGNPDEIDPFV